MAKGLANTPRILNKIAPPCSLQSVGSLLMFTPLTNSNGWTIVPANNGTESVAVWRGYIDLAGYEIEQLTFFLQAATVLENQEINSFQFGETGTDMMECISKVRITDVDINHPWYSETNLYSPGFMDSKQDMEEILWCRYRQFYHEAAWSDTTMLRPSTTKVWGEGQATAGNRLHLTRIVKLANEQALCQIPQACFNVVGVALDEPDLEYIMRLRRDFELATQA